MEMTELDKVIKEWESVLSRDPLDAPWDLIDDTLALLKEQETSNLYKCPNCGTWVSAENVVRCKDCKHGEKANDVYLCGKPRGFGLAHEPNWFCADGERR